MSFILEFSVVGVVLLSKLSCRPFPFVEMSSITSLGGTNMFYVVDVTTPYDYREQL